MNGSIQAENLCDSLAIRGRIARKQEELSLGSEKLLLHFREIIGKKTKA